MGQALEVAILRAGEEGTRAWERGAEEVLAGRLSLHPVEWRTTKGSEEHDQFTFCKDHLVTVQRPDSHKDRGPGLP